jgi:hypothetical protein
MHHYYTNPLPSISHYHYTRASGIFAIILGLIGIFLIIYTYDNQPTDFILSTIAGIAAICVILFPTDNLSIDESTTHEAIVTTLLPANQVRENWHFIFAAVFLISLACMSLFLFTKSNKNAGNRCNAKVSRNRIYRTCAFVMIGALLLITSTPLFDLPLFKDAAFAQSWKAIYKHNNLTFWMETIAVEAFGISWLIKGDTIFKDPDNLDNKKHKQNGNESK